MLKNKNFLKSLVDFDDWLIDFFADCICEELRLNHCSSGREEGIFLIETYYDKCVDFRIFLE